MNFILNGQGHGTVADVLMAANFDPNALRPWVGRDGRNYVTVNSGRMDDAGKPIFNSLVINAPASLRKDDWIQLDTAVRKAAMPRLRVVGDLRGAGLQYVIPNGLGKTVLQHETQSDISAATISMDGLREGESDRPHFDITNLPLPIVHKDFQYSARQVMASRNGGSPLDTTSAELAGRKVAEEVEKLTLGEVATYAYGGGTVYGMTNYTYRLTQALTAPDGTNQATTITEILTMIQSSQAAGYYGPWGLYYSPGWSIYMGGDYASAKGDNTLQERIAKIDGISFVRQADYLSDTTLILVQLTGDVIRMVIGMDITTVQWESHGGMQLNFKVMAIIVPQLRADYNDATGIVHGSV